MIALTAAGLALLAGSLSTLSPCVLPLLPIVLGAAISDHRWGPLALAAGVASAFSLIGLFVATIGFSIGLDGDAFRLVGAMLLGAIGIVLMTPQLQTRLASAAGPISDWTSSRLGQVSSTGWRGQLGVGLLLGVVWSPCVGPTLGAASLIAARGENLAQVGLVMAAFGVGAAAPLILFGALSREVLLRRRMRMLVVGERGKAALGSVMVLVAALIVGGFDRKLEALAVELFPGWLVDLTSRF